MSGIQVRYLKIVEKSGYQALPWVRYITQHGDGELSPAQTSVDQDSDRLLIRLLAADESAEVWLDCAHLMQFSTHVSFPFICPVVKDDRVGNPCIRTQVGLGQRRLLDATGLPEYSTENGLTKATRE